MAGNTGLHAHSDPICNSCGIHVQVDLWKQLRSRIFCRLFLVENRSQANRRVTPCIFLPWVPAVVLRIVSGAEKKKHLIEAAPFGRLDQMLSKCDRLGGDQSPPAKNRAVWAKTEKFCKFSHLYALSVVPLLFKMQLGDTKKTRP